MRTKSFEMNYYNTYYFANIIDNVIKDGFEYLRKISEFFESYMYLSNKFERYSLLHQFIKFVIDDLFYESIDEDLKNMKEKTISSGRKKNILDKSCT